MKLGYVLQEYCYQKHIGLREMSKEFNCSAATLSRFFNGEKIQSDTLALILNWLLKEAHNG